MTQPDLSEFESVSANKVQVLLAAVEGLCQGPREAYGALCATIVMLNEHHFTPPASLDVLADEVAETIRSMR
jgi:hypothetical protein